MLLFYLFNISHERVPLTFSPKKYDPYRVFLRKIQRGDKSVKFAKNRTKREELQQNPCGGGTSI